MGEGLHLLGAIAGSLTLTCLSAYVALASSGRSELLYSTISARPNLRWNQVAFFLLSGVGLIVCLYQGAEFMLSWMPERWGGVGDDGEHTPLRVYLAGLFATAAGLALCQFIDRATHEKFGLRLAQLRGREIEGILKLLGYANTTDLMARAREYEQSADAQPATPLGLHTASLYAYLASLTRDCETSLTRRTRHLEEELRRIRELRRRDEDAKAVEARRQQARATAEEWELDYLRKNPGSRVVVRTTDEGPSGSFFAVRELLSPSGDVIRRAEFSRLVT
jgi:hypothetical protein